MSRFSELLAEVAREDRAFNDLSASARDGAVSRLCDRITNELSRLREVGVTVSDAWLVSARDAMGLSSPPTPLPSPPPEAVCLGLGQPEHSAIALTQLAWFLDVAERLPLAAPVEVFEPLLSSLARAALERLGARVVSVNDEGKRRAAEAPRRTLFFMPHCGKSLYSNVLWANWGEPLASGRVSIIGNSMALMLDQIEWSGTKAATEVASLVAMAPYTDELRVPLDSTLEHRANIRGALNDTALMTFTRMPPELPRPIEWVWSLDATDSAEMVPQQVTSKAKKMKEEEEEEEEEGEEEDEEEKVRARDV